MGLLAECRYKRYNHYLFSRWINPRQTPPAALCTRPPRVFMLARKAFAFLFWTSTLHIASSRSRARRTSAGGTRSVARFRQFPRSSAGSKRRWRALRIVKVLQVKNLLLFVYTSPEGLIVGLILSCSEWVREVRTWNEISNWRIFKRFAIVFLCVKLWLYLY